MEAEDGGTEEDGGAQDEDGGAQASDGGARTDGGVDAGTRPDAGVRLDADRCVGRTSLMVHGWRPYSATTQPSSAASHGSGIAHTANRNSQRRLATLRRAQ